MASQKTPLILIPGLGDRTRAYHMLVPVWKFLGYDIHIFSFGWEDGRESFPAALDRLVKYTDHFNGKIGIIGVSAGGTAAVNVLALRPRVVKRVVTVATPYALLPGLAHAKLKDSILCMRQASKNKANSKILSMHGLYDQTVPVTASQPEGIRTQKIYAATHVFVIAVALIFYMASIRRFIEKNR